jgi:hypothetical protein
MPRDAIIYSIILKSVSDQNAIFRTPELHAPVRQMSPISAVGILDP